MGSAVRGDAGLARSMALLCKHNFHLLDRVPGFSLTAVTLAFSLECLTPVKIFL